MSLLIDLAAEAVHTAVGSAQAPPPPRRVPLWVALTIIAVNTALVTLALLV